MHYSDAPTTPKMLISVEEKTKQQKANLTAEEQALWVSGDIRWVQVKDDDKNDVFIPAKFKSKSTKKFEGNKLIFEQIPSPWLSPEGYKLWKGMDRRIGSCWSTNREY